MPNPNKKPLGPPQHRPGKRPIMPPQVNAAQWDAVEAYKVWAFGDGKEIQGEPLEVRDALKRQSDPDFLRLEKLMRRHG